MKLCYTDSWLTNRRIAMKTFLIVAALFAGIGSASAADLGGGPKDGPLVSFPDDNGRADWNGLYVDLGVGYSQGDLYAEEYIDGLFATSTPLIVGTVGFDAQMGNVVVGAFGEAAYLSPSMLGFDLDDKGIDANYQLCGGARGGLAFGRTLVYANGGYCWVPVDIDGFDEDIDLAGPFVGGGLAHQIQDGFYVDFQGRYTWLEDEIDGHTLNHDDLSLRVKVGKHF
jgi:opacity protein-like surface antigen